MPTTQVGTLTYQLPFQGFPHMLHSPMVLISLQQELLQGTIHLHALNIRHALLGPGPCVVQIRSCQTVHGIHHQLARRQGARQ